MSTSQIVSNPRTKFLVNFSRIFKKFGNKAEGKSEEELYEITEKHLLEGLLSKEQRGVLQHTHWRKPYPHEGNKTVKTTLLRRLISDACFKGQGLGKAETRLYMSKDFTGVESEVELREITQSINLLWIQEKRGATLLYDEKDLNFAILPHFPR
jgi:hypothetical protein